MIGRDYYGGKSKEKVGPLTYERCVYGKKLREWHKLVGKVLSRVANARVHSYGNPTFLTSYEITLLYFE